MAAFKKTYVAPFQQSAGPSSADVEYWKSLSTPILLKEVNAIDFIDMSPVEPHFIAVSCSSRIQLYHPITRMVHKNYNRFKQAAYGAVFRKDGRLLLSGSDENALKLFDVSSKNLLRVYKGHERAVHRCCFMPADNQIVSFSDDKTLIQWDLASEELLHKYEGHTDYVRCGAASRAHPDLIFSGSYDHTVKVWDRRDKSESMCVNHGAPVESIAVSPSGSLLFTAGGTEIKIWDTLAGGKLLANLSQHHKTITFLKFATNGRRLLSASLDRHVKVYDMSSFEVLHTFTYASPILSLGISEDDSVLAVGMTDGILAISKREEKVADNEPEEVTQAQRTKKKIGNYSDFVSTDYGIQEIGSTKDQPYDAYLRKFRYTKALDSVLTDQYLNSKPAVTVALLQELMRRDGLKKALAGREGKSLAKILRFLVRHLRRPKFMRVLIQVSHILIDLIADQVGENQDVDKLLVQLCEEVRREVLYVIELMELQGCLEMIMINSGDKASEATNDNEAMVSSRDLLPGNKLTPSNNALERVIVRV